MKRPGTLARPIMLSTAALVVLAVLLTPSEATAGVHDIPALDQILREGGIAVRMDWDGWPELTFYNPDGSLQYYEDTWHGGLAGRGLLSAVPVVGPVLAQTAGDDDYFNQADVQQALQNLGPDWVNAHVTPQFELGPGGAHRVARYYIDAAGTQDFINELDRIQGARGGQAGVRAREVTQARLGEDVTIWDKAGNVILWILYYLVYLVAWLLYLFIEVSGRFLDVLLSIKAFAGGTFVQTGWRFVRDLLNFFFVLALLAIAFSYIAGLEGYQARRMLPRLIFAALLVNFSLAIGGAIVGFSNAVMCTELKAIGVQCAQPAAVPASARAGPGSTLSTKIAESGQVAKYFSLGEAKITGAIIGLDELRELETNNPISLTEKTFVVNFAGFMGAVVVTFFLGFIAIVFLALAGLFLVRTVALLILLILSPVPYVLSLIPGKEGGISAQWWRHFSSYTMFGPLAILFIVLKIKYLDTEGGVFSQLGMDTSPLGRQVNQELFKSFFETLFNGTLILLSLYFARRLGIAFADRIQGWATAAVKDAAGGAAMIAGVRLPREVGKAAAYGVLKAGEWKPEVEGGMRGRIGARLRKVGGYAAGAVRPLAGAYQYGRRVVTGETTDAMIERQKKPISHLGATGIMALARTGNLGAQALAAERGYAKSSADLGRIYGSAPLGTKHRENVIKEYRERFPITGTERTRQVGENVGEEIQKAWRKLRDPEKLGRALADAAEGEEILRRINLPVRDSNNLPVYTRSQAEALMESLEGTAALQTAIQQGTAKGAAKEFAQRVLRGGPGGGQQPPPPGYQQGPGGVLVPT